MHAYHSKFRFCTAAGITAVESVVTVALPSPSQPSKHKPFCIASAIWHASCGGANGSTPKLTTTTSVQSGGIRCKVKLINPSPDRAVHPSQVNAGILCHAFQVDSCVASIPIARSYSFAARAATALRWGTGNAGLSFAQKRQKLASSTN